MAVKAIHIVVSVLLIITVLLQPGKGDDLGTIFGGSSQSIFGASGAVPFLTKLTRVLAVVFIITSLSLGYFYAKGIRSSVIEESGSLPKQELVIPPTKKRSSTSPTSLGPGPEAGQESALQGLTQTPEPRVQPQKGSK